MKNMKRVVVLIGVGFLCLSLGMWYFGHQRTNESEAVKVMIGDEPPPKHMTISPVTTSSVSASPMLKAQAADAVKTNVGSDLPLLLEEPKITILPAAQMGYSTEEVLALHKKLEQERLQGYSAVSEEDVQRIDNHVTSKGVLLPVNNALPQLSFYPSQLQSGSPLWRQDQLLGIQPAGAFIEGKGWSSAASVHAVNGVGNVLLVETVLGQGDSVGYPLETVNSVIKGHAAVLTVEVAPPGKALSRLTWTTNERDYALYVHGNANSNAELKAALFDLANALPMPYGDFQLSSVNQQ